MNSSELGTILGINPTTITRRVEKAKAINQENIKLKERYFKFEMIKGHYSYEEIFAEVIDTADTELSSVWRRASEEQQELASKRLKLVRLYRNRPSNETWQKFLSRMEYKYREIKPSKSKLFRWLDIVRRCEESGEVALEHLLDSRGKQTGNRSYTDTHYEFMKLLFKEKPHRELVKIHEYMSVEFGDDAPSYATVRRMMQRFKESEPYLVMIATNPSEANNKLRPAPGNASEIAGYTNAVWELDGTPVDVMCSDGVRYQLSAAIDVYSRRVVVVVTPTANASALAKVFKKGITKLGVPEAVLLDNGKEYKSKTFEYTCSRLRIEQRFTMPYSGWQKPHIERFFGTLTRDLFEELPGYKGHSVSDSQQIQAQNTYEDKMKAKERAKEAIKHGNAAAKKLAKEQKELDLYLPTTLNRSELEDVIDRWVVKYEQKLHRGIKESPLQKWDECVIPRRTISDTRVLDVLVGLSEKKKVTKKGITWKSLTYWHDNFFDMVGQSVWMLSDDELGYLYIYDLEMNFLCKAENPELVGKSRADYLASRFHDAKMRKKIRELYELRREAPERYRDIVLDEAIKDENRNEENSVDVGLEYKSPAVSAVRESLADESSHSVEEQEELKDESTETLVINGRPMFASIKERFDWDLENNRVDETTEKLALRHEGLWELALEEYTERKAG